MLPICPNWIHYWKIWVRLVTAQIWTNRNLVFRQMSLAIRFNVRQLIVYWMNWQMCNRVQFMPCQMGKNIHSTFVKVDFSNRFMFICSVSSNPKSPGGKHVTITVRETKTERLTPGPDVERQIIQSNYNSQYNAPRASSATKELDDLMASLSDFKVSLSPHFFYIQRRMNPIFTEDPEKCLFL